MTTQEFPRKRAFFYHYNRNASVKAGHPVLTVHLGGKCYMARSLNIGVPCTTRERKQQPQLVLHGYCNSISVDENSITLL